MGNFLNPKGHVVDICENNSPIEASKLSTIDPRSPTKGIVRTPIQIGNAEYLNKCFDPRSPSFGVERTPVNYQNNNIDCNNGENIDGLLTEDDSIHRSPVDHGRATFSDTELANSFVCKENRYPDSDRQEKISRFQKQVKRKSMHESPSLFMRLRQKKNYEKHKVERSNLADISNIELDAKRHSMDERTV